MVLFTFYWRQKWGMESWKASIVVKHQLTLSTEFVKSDLFPFSPLTYVSLYTFKALLDSTCSLEYPSSADESSKILVKHLFLLPVQQGSRRYFHHHNTLHSARVRWTVHDCSQEPCGKINAWTYPQSLQQCLLQWDKQVRLHLQMWSVSKYRGVKENWLGNGLSGLIVPELSALKLNYCLVTSSW